MSSNGTPSAQPRSSRARFAEYRDDLRAHRTEGSRRSAEAHSRDKREAGERQRSFLALFFAFFRLLGGQRRVVFGALVLLTMATVLGLIPPYGTKIVFDNVLDTNPLPALVRERVPLPLPADRRTLLAVVAITMVTVEAVAIVIGLGARWLTTRTTKRVQMAIRRRVFGHAVNLPLHRVYELKSGGAASILREDAGGIADLIFAMIYNPWKAIVRLLGSLAILATVDWRLLLGSLLLLPTVYLTHRAWIGRIRPVWRDIRHSRQTIDGQATESFGGMRVVRAFGRQRAETQRFTVGNHFMARQELFAWWWSRGVDVAWSILIPTALAALLWYGGWRVLSDEARIAAGAITYDQALTKGDLVMFLAYLMMLLEPLAVLASSATAFQNSLAGLDRVLDLLDEPREIDVDDDAGAVTIDPASVAGRITLRDVSFAYPGTDRVVLEGIDLDVEPGETIALVGSSGAGKTTLCNLVARFYDPDAGAIELDGRDLRAIRVESFRHLLGIVEQDIFLFDGTIAENIGYGRHDATRDEIAAAAERAYAHEFIMEFPRDYDTLIGERGVKLSGGQRQRLAIARAMLADPRILILDEATSNLDTESERVIQASLAELMNGRTSFVIAHRLSTVTHADRIVVLEGGRVVEQGTHEQLMERSGRYRRMVELQFEAPLTR
ncbi:MAG: ABC transporter ATP-binding protein, partial [Planctomycetota bacterium]